MNDKDTGEKLIFNGTVPGSNGKKTKRSDFETQEEWDNYKLVRDAQKKQRIKKGKEIARPQKSNPGTFSIRVNESPTSLEELPINTIFSSVPTGHNAMMKADSRRVINLSSGKSENFTFGQVFVIWMSPYAEVQIDGSSPKQD